MDSLSFCFLGKAFTFHFFWEAALPGIVFLADNFTFNISNISPHSLLVCRVSAHSLIGGVVSRGRVVCDVLLFCFFQYHSVFDFWQCHYDVSLGSTLWHPLGLMTLDVHVSLQVWEVFSHYCFTNAFCPFLFIFLPAFS